MTEQTKTCPFCAETIKAAAVVCRFCNRDINNVDAKTSSANAVALRNCPDCHGRGDFKETCPGCGGTHYEQCGQCYGDGWTTDGYGRDTCTNCRGSGREMCMCCPNSQGYDEVTCESCQGTGQLTHEAFGALMQKKQEAKQAADLQRQAAERQRAEEAKRKEEERQKNLQEMERLRQEEEERRQEAARRAQLAELQQRENLRSDAIKERVRSNRCVICGQKFGLFSKKAQVQINGSVEQPGLFYKKTNNQYGRCWNCFSTRTV